MTPGRWLRWRWSLPLLTGIFFLVAWTVVKHVFGFERFYLPTPLEVLEEGWKERHALTGAALSTLSGAVIGFLAAAFVGGGIAVVLASSKWVRVSFYPHVLIVQMFPVIILAPLFVLWWKPGLHSVSAVTFVIAFFPVVANATQGLISTNRNMVDLFKLTGAGPLQEFILLRIPHALPYYLTGLRVAASLAMIGAITGELFAGSTSGGIGGLGFMAVVYYSQVNTPAVMATGFVACLCGFLFVGSVVALSWFLLRNWHESVEQPDI